MGGSAQKSVLLVEDNIDARELLSAILQQHGIDVTEAVDGIDALDKMLKRCPDLILTDLRMPNMNGLELAKYVKASESYRHIPIILISATLPFVRRDYPEITAFVQKPLSINTLIPTIKGLLL
jgi:CheY-like chemotaxis protein